MRQQKDCSPVSVVRDWFTAHEKEIDWSRIKTELSSTGAVAAAFLYRYLEGRKQKMAQGNAEKTEDAETETPAEQ